MLEKITHSAVAAAVVCATTAYFPAHADTKDAWTVSTAVQLAEDVTVTGELTLDGGSIDLNGHVLTVKNVTGSGVIVDAANDKFALYRKLQYLESTTAGKQFIDTGYIHNPRSNVRVKFSHPSYHTKEFPGRRRLGGLSPQENPDQRTISFPLAPEKRI